MAPQSPPSPVATWRDGPFGRPEERVERGADSRDHVEGPEALDDVAGGGAQGRADGPSSGVVDRRHVDRELLGETGGGALGVGEFAERGPPTAVPVGPGTGAELLRSGQRGQTVRRGHDAARAGRPCRRARRRGPTPTPPTRPPRAPGRGVACCSSAWPVPAVWLSARAHVFSLVGVAVRSSGPRAWHGRSSVVSRTTGRGASAAYGPLGSPAPWPASGGVGDGERRATGHPGGGRAP